MSGVIDDQGRQWERPGDLGGPGPPKSLRPEPVGGA